MPNWSRTNSGAVILNDGHVDIASVHRDGVFTTTVKDTTVEGLAKKPAASRPTGTTRTTWCCSCCRSRGPRSRTTRGTPARRAAGSPVWQVSQTQQAGLLWPGWSTEHLEQAAHPDGIRWTLAGAVTSPTPVPRHPAGTSPPRSATSPPTTVRSAARSSAGSRTSGAGPGAGGDAGSHGAGQSFRRHGLTTGCVLGSRRPAPAAEPLNWTLVFGWSCPLTPLPAPTPPPLPSPRSDPARSRVTTSRWRMSQATAASATPGSEVISSGRTFPCSIYKITPCCHWWQAGRPGSPNQRATARTTSIGPTTASRPAADSSAMIASGDTTYHL